MLLTLSGCSSNPPKNIPVRQGTLEQAVGLASSHRVFRLHVFYIPEDTVVESPVDERRMETGALGEVSLALFQVCHVRSKLLAQLSSMSPAGEVASSDRLAGNYRWACIFYSNRGERLVTLYLRPDGYGRINGIRIKADKQLVDLLRQEFACLVNSWQGKQ